MKYDSEELLKELFFALKMYYSSRLCNLLPGGFLFYYIFFLFFYIDFARGTKGKTGVQQKVGLVELYWVLFLCPLMIKIPDLEFVSAVRVGELIKG